MSDRPDPGDEAEASAPVPAAVDDAPLSRTEGSIADILDALSVEALMEEALEMALATEDPSEPSGEPAGEDLQSLYDEAAGDQHVEMLQAGPAADEMLPGGDEPSGDGADPARPDDTGDAVPFDDEIPVSLVSTEEYADDEHADGADEGPGVEPGLSDPEQAEQVAFAPDTTAPDAVRGDIDRLVPPLEEPFAHADIPVGSAQVLPITRHLVPEGATETDLRFMAAAIRLSRRNLGLTSTNPSVGTLIVRDGVIVGRGVTAVGGRPHAETQALAEAGEAARGATAYVTLEPCAHHGRTPPCAEALVSVGIARVVGAAADPDDRVSGRGYAILRAAGIKVVEGVLSDRAADLMAGYLSRSSRKRPEVILKLALSSDGMIGRIGEGQVQITGGIARAQVHLMRAESDAILVGIGTVEADDPELNVRLPGLEDRAPVRIVLDRAAKLPMMSKLALSARTMPLYVAVGPEASPVRRSSLEMLGVQFLATETHDGRIALPELLEDLAGRGISSVMVEGGATTARAFLDDDVVDRIVLFRGPNPIGDGGIPSPVTADTMPEGFRLVREARYGIDQCQEWVRG